jgi:hypothetical protein
MPSPEKLLSTAHQLLAFDKALARGIAIPSTERLFVLRRKEMHGPGGRTPGIRPAARHNWF